MKVEENRRFEIPCSSFRFLRLFALKAILPSSGASSLVLDCSETISASVSGPNMKKARKCRACQKPFGVDLRNEGRHAYCSRPDCQRQRRRLAQNFRRARRPRLETTQTPAAASRLQGRLMKPREADMHLENPLFIGLISMLTGSTDLEEIQAVGRKLYQRGCNILGLKQDRRSRSFSE